jgi:argininosuccinate lyase
MTFSQFEMAYREDFAAIAKKLKHTLPQMAQNGLGEGADRCPLLGDNRT